MDKVLFTIKRKHIVITVSCIFLILIFTILLTKQYNFTYDNAMYYDTETKNVVIISIPAIFTTTVASYILLSITGLLICNVSYCFSRKYMSLKNIFLRTNSKIYVIVGMLQAFIIVYNLSEMAMFAENCAIQILDKI